MIIYQNSVTGFQNDVDNNSIADKIEQNFIEKVGHTVSPSEKRSWNNSLYRMGTIVRLSKIPDTCWILIEYNIPSTSKRIDFLVCGQDKNKNKNFIIVELKQWEKATRTDMPFLVNTFIHGNYHDVTHPSYQAYSYKHFLCDMSTAVYEKNLHPYSCAYLHNYKVSKKEPLLDKQYAEFYTDTPMFFQNDASKLERYFYEHVGQGNGKGIADDFEDSKIKPSKKFIEYVSELFQNNPAYILLDEQVIAYAKIMKYACASDQRMTILVNGGPGTGKSVVAMNVFVDLLKTGKNVQFVAPNSSFKSAMIDVLAWHRVEAKNRLTKIFSGSTKFYEAPPLSYDVLIVDEAHRLKAKGTYMYKGDSQVEDVIKASRVNVFFIDDEQMIRPNDEGSMDYVEAVAQKNHSEVIKVHLNAQFRCSGADGFVSWVEHTLQIRDTANFDGWDKKSFEFKIMDTPQELERYIYKKQCNGDTARIVAGFAWPWTAAKNGNPDAEVADVTIPKYGYARPWNSRHDQYTWAIDETKSHQIGCIHTSQGLEFDYIGVILGKDIYYDPANHTVNGDYANYYDKTGKVGLKNKPDELSRYIKNIYRVLMTRGIKGCAIFCCDKNMQAYMRERLKTVESNTLRLLTYNDHKAS